MKCFHLLGFLLFLGVAVAPSIYADVKEPEIVETEKILKNINGRCVIIGMGDISWLHAENVSWHFGGPYRGIWKTNLIIGNGPGGTTLGYYLCLKDLDSGEFLYKTTLPRHIYLLNFSGYLKANYYSWMPHGPTGFYFSIVGRAEDYFPDW